MALAASQFTNTKRWQICPGRWGFTGTFTGPASYASGGETLTDAIWKAATGLKGLYAINFMPMLGNANTNAVGVAFDHTKVAGTSQGKIHIFDQVGAHTHDLLVVGGQGAGVALQIDVDSAAGVVGKTAATNRTLPGVAGTKNIGAPSGTTGLLANEAPATTNYGGFVCTFRGEGY